MARMTTKQVSNRERYWRRFRFVRLRQFFADNEIIQARLNLLTTRNKVLRKVVRQRIKLLKSITKGYVVGWKKSVDTLEGEKKFDEANELRQRIADTVEDAKNFKYSKTAKEDAFNITLKRLRDKGKELRDLLGEASP